MAPWEALPRYPRLRYAAPRAKGAKKAPPQTQTRAGPSAPQRQQAATATAAAAVGGGAAGLVDGDDAASEPTPRVEAAAPAQAEEEEEDGDSGAVSGDEGVASLMKAATGSGGDTAAPRVVWQREGGSRRGQRPHSAAPLTAPESRWREPVLMHLPSDVAGLATAEALARQNADEVARIKAALARKGLSVSTAALDRVYSVRRDVDPAEAQRHVPAAGADLVANPLAPSAAAGKKGKGKGKKGKKKKKKK